MFDVAVIGGGHAGVEAARAAAMLGMHTVLFTFSKQTIAQMPCNPSIGGPAKGILVREIDALGGLMGQAADATMLQIKLLNMSKGPGVRCLRVQSDKIAYQRYVLEQLEQVENLTIIEDEIFDLKKEDCFILRGIEDYQAKVVIVTTGTYLNGKILRGKTAIVSGPEGQKASIGLTAALTAFNHQVMRLKTGTPPRIKKDSIDFSNATIEGGMELSSSFSSYSPRPFPLKDQENCYLIHTAPSTHQIIHENIKESAMYSGMVVGVGPRYCPSIEDKLVRFADKESHQLFLEPESRELDTIYLQGFSTSMPCDIQEKMIHSLPGFANAEIVKYAYAIEYDAFNPQQLKMSLESKLVDGLFLAGQINGTSGYEEAAAQGLMAGINAAYKLQQKQPLVLRRDQAYIGVLIDDLIVKGIKDPYRMLTSRCEYRLLLRHDNVIERLLDSIKSVGLIKKDVIELKEREINEEDSIIDSFTKRIVKRGEDKFLDEAIIDFPDNGITLFDALKRPEVTIEHLTNFINRDHDSLKRIEIKIKYSGYIEKEKKEVAKLANLEKIIIPDNFVYDDAQLSKEARDKLSIVRPTNLLQASRISGVNLGDIAILLRSLK